MIRVLFASATLGFLASPAAILAPVGPQVGGSCPGGSACLCNNHWYDTPATSPPACHGTVSAALYSWQHGCCLSPADGCNDERKCNGIIAVTATAKSGMTCAYQISGPGGNSDCPSGCASLTHRENYKLDCGDWSVFQVWVTVSPGNQVLVDTITLDCDHCAG